MSAWDFLRGFHFASRERPGTMATASEVKRWLQGKCVHANGEILTWDEPMDFPIISLVLFPKSDRITLY